MPTTAMSRHTRLLTIATLVVALAGCGSSAASSDDPTTTTTTAERKATTTTAASDSGSSALPTKEEDAPSGTWVGVRYLTEKTAAGNPAGFAEARTYEIEPSCDDGPCDLTLGPVDGSFALPDLDGTDLGTEPIELQATDEGTWATTYNDTYGCSDELDGDYVRSEATLELAPVRAGGRIVNLVGTVTYDDELTPAGKTAGCTEDALASSTYDVAIADESSIDRPFEIEGSYFETIEVSRSEHVDAASAQPGYSGYQTPEKGSTFRGGCDDKRCEVTRRIPTRPDEPTVTMTREEDGGDLTGSSVLKGSCTDPATGEQVEALAAYDSTVTYALFPVLVEGGQAKVLLGQVTRTSTPTELGRLHPGVCDQEQSLATYEYFVAPDLYS